jgi:hypothetical protein
MSPGNFSSEDKQKVIEYLNIIAKKAVFTLNTQEVIEYFKLISFMQQVLIPKIDNNILEVSRVFEAPKEEVSKEESKKETKKVK